MKPLPLGYNIWSLFLLVSTSPCVRHKGSPCGYGERVQWITTVTHALLKVRSQPHCLPTAGARVQVWVKYCDICGGKSDTGERVLRLFRFPLPLIPFTSCSTVITIYHPGLVKQANKWRIVSSGMLRRVTLVRTDVSEELSTSFIRVTRIGELGTTLAVTSNTTWYLFAACFGC
jgi:hypothetical protein